jgi:hypothetical protein
MVLVTALVFPGVGAATAQESPPNLRMLLNLDLFAAHRGNSNGPEAPGNNGATPGTNDSMVDQIRTLNALGYLKTKQNLTGATASDAGVNGPPQANPPTGNEEPE